MLREGEKYNKLRVADVISTKTFRGSTLQCLANVYEAYVNLNTHASTQHNVPNSFHCLLPGLSVLPLFERAE